MLLTPKEKTLLENPNADPKKRGNLNYRLRGKIKKILDEITEINDLLYENPATRDALNDEAVTSVLKLSENLLYYLGYVPIKEGREMGQSFVIRSRPKPTRSYERSTEFKVKIEAATQKDIIRQTIIENHIEELHRLGFLTPKLMQALQFRDETTELPLFEPFGESLKIGKQE